MKNTKIFKSLLFISVTIVGLTSCGNRISGSSSTSSSITTTSIPPIEVNSLKTALLAMNANKNYTIEYSGDLLKPHSYFFTEVSISRHSSKYLDTDISYYFDGNGTYQINYFNNKYVSSEYRILEKTPWEYSIVKTMFNVATEYINSIDGSVTELTITSKPYRIAFLEMIGKDVTDFVNLNLLVATYNSNQSLTFTMVFSDKTYIYIVKDFHKTTDPIVTEYVNNKQGKVYELSDSWKSIRTAFETDNYCHDIYNFGETEEETGFVGTNYFNSKYFFYKYFSMPEFSVGYIPVNLPDSQVYGTYQFSIDESTSPASLNMGSMVSDSRDLSSILNYPSHLYLWQNMQFFTKFDPESIQISGLSENAIQTNDAYTLANFANNFDIDSSFSGQVPYSLVIDYVFTNDKVSKCNFYYVFSLAGLYYMMPIPFHSFGKANSNIVEQAYKMLNVDAQ